MFIQSQDISPTRKLIHISTCYNALSVQCQQSEAHYHRSFSVAGAESNSSIPGKAICIQIEDLVNSEVVQHVYTCSVRSLISRQFLNYLLWDLQTISQLSSVGFS